MQRPVLVPLALFVSMAFGALMLGVAPGVAQSSRTPGASAATEAEPLVRHRARPRTRLRVQPLYPYRRSHSLYPLPYDYEFPGPNAKRACVDAYVTEYRPSGTVIVPRMRCRWVRG
jgi:hypothetical protein